MYAADLTRKNMLSVHHVIYERFLRIISVRGEYNNISINSAVNFTMYIIIYSVVFVHNIHNGRLISTESIDLKQFSYGIPLKLMRNKFGVEHDPFFGTLNELEKINIVLKIRYN